MNTHEDDERDGLDIQSLSVVEAEFFFNKTDEGKSAADLAATKRTINLDAFHIIKVIGKGNVSFDHAIISFFLLSFVSSIETSTSQFFFLNVFDIGLFFLTS